MTGQKNKVSVVFRIVGSAGEIAGLAAKVLALPGSAQLRPPTISEKSLPEAWWAMEIVRINAESTEQAISESLEIARSNRSILEASENLRVELDCTVEIDVDRPVLEVSAESIGALANFRASIGFEVHDYRD